MEGACHKTIENQFRNQRKFELMVQLGLYLYAVVAATADTE